MSWLLLLHAAATGFMCGLIFFVQIVHYPLFARVGRGEFVAYQKGHMRRTTWVVGPPMLVEGASAVALLFWVPEGIDPALLWFGLVLLLAIWASTFFLQVPRHEILLAGFDERAHAFLVRSNWLRTTLWSARALLVLFFMCEVLPP